MEVKIGIQSIPRELIIETKATAEEIQRQLSAESADGTGLLVLADTHGGTVLVPVDKIAYVEFAGSEQRRVGFGS